MAEPRISLILIGLVSIGLFATGISGFLADGVTEYSGSSNNYNSSAMTSFTGLTAQLEDQVNTTNNAFSNLGTGSNSIYDIFGSFFASSWTAIKTTASSISLFQNIISLGVSSLPFVNSTFFSVLTSSLMMIVIIIIVIAILFNFISKSSRL